MMPDAPKSEQQILSPEIEARFENERRERQRELVAQEHRIIPAVINVLSALQQPPEDRRQQMGPAVGALLWCLVPGPAVAGVGLVALLSLFVAYQQMKLLEVQNDRIQTQNILAEAQRRSGLIFESTALFQQIDTEKLATGDPATHLCAEGRPELPCWRTATNGRRLFVPSPATTGRLVALTQALRPYRYLSVETGAPYRLVSNRDQRNLCPEEIHGAGIANVVGAWSFALADRKPPPVASSYAAGQGSSWSFTDIIRWRPRWVASSSPRLDAELNCSPSSPERGQLLIALSAAQVDLSHLGEQGADFRYADAPGARLSFAVLRNIDLSNARLSGAAFTDAELAGVNFSNADLAGARFTRADLKDVEFNRATLQSFADGGAFSSMFGVRKLSGTLVGIRIVEEADNSPLFQRLCIVGRLARRLHRARPEGRELVYDTFRRHGLLTETAFDPASGRERRVAFIVEADGGPSRVLYNKGRVNAAGHVTLRYDPFSSCNGWPQAPTKPST